MKYQRFIDALKERVIVLDGAMGTMIQQLNLSAENFGGEPYLMLSDILSFSKPEELKAIHLEYYRAGSNAVETNTFGASPLRLSEYDFSGLDTSCFEGIPEGVDLTAISQDEMTWHMNVASCKIARQALEEYKLLDEYDGRPLFVIGSVGPSNYVLSGTEADLKKGTWELIENNFRGQVAALIDGGADVVLFETQQDILEVKAAVSGALKAMDEKGVRLPIMAQVTVNEFSRMQIFNTDIVAALTTVQDIGIDVFGINCSIGPDLMEPTVKKLSEFSTLPISVLPNAGLPEAENGFTVYKLGPDHLAEYLQKFAGDYGVNIVGGCCGTSPAHIRAISEAVKGITPPAPRTENRLFLSGPQNAVEIDSSENLIRIGERLNVRGSKKVRDAVENADDIDFGVLEEVVREQVFDLGASILDVCMDSNLVDTTKVLPEVVRAMNVDFTGAMSLDSFDAEALKEAVKAYPGRPLINSISMEEFTPGVSKAEKILEYTAFHSPLYIGLCADDSGPAQTAEKKVEIAEKLMQACESYNIPASQLFVDINAFPIGSESVEGMNFAGESLRSIPEIKKLHPGIKTTIGVSNLTNGLAKKPYMRMVLTSVFLDEGKKLGLDAAIVNPSHYVPVENIDGHDYNLALKIIQDRDMEAFEELEEIAQVKRGKKVTKAKSYDELPSEISVCEKIKDGVKEKKNGQIEVNGRMIEYRDAVAVKVAEALQKIKPIDFINDYLMEAMKELGERFSAGEVSLPHLLKSADVMKQVMDFIESFMGKDQSGEINYKGTIVLGTVFQDVHSIGKDLTKTLMENYGYRVIDLGVQVPLEDFIKTAIREKADAIGMSSLLVQTANHMITVTQMMEEAGLDIPVLIGGAPVNMRHAAYVAMKGREDVKEIKPDIFYCSSAMDCVNIMANLLSDKRDAYVAGNGAELEKHYLRAVNRAKMTEELRQTLPVREITFDGYTVPDAGYGSADFRPALSEIGLNIKTLHNLNWKAGGKKFRDRNNISDENMEEFTGYWISEAEKNGWIDAAGRIAFFPCNSIGDTLVIYDPENPENEAGRIDFDVLPSRDKKEQYSLARYFMPADQGTKDIIGFQISTAGAVSKESVENFKKANDSEAAHLIQGLSDRVAEDLAGVLNKELKKSAGPAGADGKRFSPGYPGVRLENNKLIHRLLRADELGINLTDVAEFSPTSTTAAIVCFHPEVEYF